MGASASVAALAGDAALIEPNFPRVVRQTIELKRWPAHLEGFSVALVSDFHYDPVFSIHPINASIGIVNKLRPDLIALTGDFVSLPYVGDPAKGAAAAEPCAQLLRQMHAPHGLWAVMGNHDAFTDPEQVTTTLRAAGIQVLANQSVPIETGGVRFWLAGLEDVLGQSADVDAALHDVPRDEATVMLVHEPDYADRVARYPVDLQLSGHSHGGQVRAPFLGPLYLPDLARKYVWGMYKIGGLTLYTNPGLGTVEVPFRFDCPAEITLITLRRS